MRTPSLLTLSLLLGFSLACAGGGSPEVTVVEAPKVAAPAPAPVAAAPAARPLYYEGELTSADLEGRSLRELALMRNTIFARQGHPFVKPWLDEYFRAQPWYHPAAKADLSKLTAADKANVKRIADAESEIDQAGLLARRDAIKAKGTLSKEDGLELRLLSAALGEWSGDEATPAAQRNPLEDPSVLDHQLTAAQIDGMSRRDLRLLRNSIYARRGRPFKSEVLQQYFFDKTWYQPDDAFTEARLTDVDKRNIQMVQSMEDRLGGPLTEWEHQAEEGWFAGA